MTTPDGGNMILGSLPMNLSLSAFHPNPGQIFRLWQTFLDNVNPLIKVIHVPTVQQQLLEASENLEDVSKSMEALMFAIYSLAAISMSNIECESIFGETKNALITRYRNATRYALIAADFITTSDLVVLQAFVLFLVSDVFFNVNRTQYKAFINLIHSLSKLWKM